VIGCFYGIVAAKKQLFPYSQMKQLYSFLTEDYEVKTLHTHVRDEFTKQSETSKSSKFINLNNLISDGRVIESLTIPFLMKSIDIASLDKFDLPKISGPAGGLCGLQNKLVLFGGKGNGILIHLETMDILGGISLKNYQTSDGGIIYTIKDVACSFDEDGQFAYIVYQILYDQVANESNHYRTAIGKIDLQNFGTGSFQNVWTSKLTGPNFGGRLSLVSDDIALISFSDAGPYGKRQDNGLFRPEDPDLLEGKILSVNLSNGEHNIFSFGHRNPQGLFVNSQGEIFETEHGPKGGDEFNLLRKGRNYGWPNVSHGVDYTSYHWKHGKAGRHEGYEPPLFAWVPSIAISNLIQVKNFHPAWAEDFLIGSLKAQSLFRLRLNKKQRVEFVEQIWIGSRIRDIEELENSQIALWTDDSKLKIISIANDFIKNDKRTTTSFTGSLFEGCLKCHHFGITNVTHLAPSLKMILSRDIASDNFKYSDALSKISGRWTRQRMKEFIMNPQEFAPGNMMVYQVADEKVADAIVDKLIEMDNMGQ